MQSDHRIACWQGAIGVLTDNDPSAACTWTLDTLVTNFQEAGIEVPRVVTERLMDPACDVFELCDAIRDYDRTQRIEGAPVEWDDVEIDLEWMEPMALHLGATGWTLQYFREVEHLLYRPRIRYGDLYKWAKAFRREFGAKKGTLTDGQVSDLIAMNEVDVRGRSVMMESDILALGFLMGTMSDTQAATCRPLLERCLVKLAWDAVDEDARMGGCCGRVYTERVYGALDARWWSPDAVLTGFKDVLLAECFKQTGYDVTFRADTNLGYGRNDGTFGGWVNADGRIFLAQKIVAATQEELKRSERVKALRRAYSATCLQKILADVLKALHDNNGSVSTFWVASQSTYDVIHAAWSEVLAERFFSMFHSILISNYLPFMRQFTLCN